MSNFKILHIPTGLYVRRGSNYSFYFYYLVSDEGDIFNLDIENERDEEIVLEELAVYFQHNINLQSYTELLLIKI